MTDINVILFGASGVGKSSIVNMLAEKNVADTSRGVKACTFGSEAYKVDILGKEMTLHDTAGIDETYEGPVPKPDAVMQLYNLLRSLTCGVSLLVFVMRGPRIKSSVSQNWKFFHDIICQKRVPIVILITGLEEENDVDQWWWDNKETLQRYGIIPQGFACITASKGKALKQGGHAYGEEFEESKVKVQNLLRSTCLDKPWIVPQAEWFKKITYTAYETRFFGLCPPKKVEKEEEQKGEAFSLLVSICGISEREAKVLVGKSVP